MAEFTNNRLYNRVNDLVYCCQVLAVADVDTTASCWSFWCTICIRTAKFEIFGPAVATAARHGETIRLACSVEKVLSARAPGWEFSVGATPLHVQILGEIDRTVFS